MRAGAFSIEGGDYERAGAASTALKQVLKKVGMPPADIRRAMIAVYEAEMNVVIHARRGTMAYDLGEDRLDVEIADEGPGIPDIPLAMREGYSTAPEEARRLGFGAGMGLPNMKRNSDAFDIRSAVGRGTTVRLSVRFDPGSRAGLAANSIRPRASACIGCMRCLHACPTAAVRVHRRRPAILGHLCIDCTVCIEACKSGALGMAADEEFAAPSADEVLLIPPSFFVDFGSRIAPRQVLAATRRLGFGEVWLTEPWDEALREAVMEHASAASVRPVISPVCPAVVNLIALKFPSLLGNVAPFAFPVEAAIRALAGRRACVVAACPSRCTLVRESGASGVRTVSPAAVRHAVQAFVAEPAAPEAEAPAGGAVRREPRGVLQVTNVRHNMAVLEQAENGLLGDIDVLELFACEGGCYGSPLFLEDAFIASQRWQKSGFDLPPQAEAVGRGRPRGARAGLRLDTDIARAMEKLAEIEDVLAALPGRNCGMCGAPTCLAMAEDIVLARAERSECVYLAARQKERSP